MSNIVLFWKLYLKVKEDITEQVYRSVTISHAVTLSGRILIAMAEVRVHAAFTVKDEELFFSEAKKMISATQVKKMLRSMHSQ